MFVICWINFHREAFSISETENTTIIDEVSSNIKDMACKFSALIKVKGTDVMDEWMYWETDDNGLIECW